MNVNEIEGVLSRKTVGIAGCGGLGSNCAVALARVGLGKMILADFDTVSEENLNRQYFFRDQVGLQKVMALKDNLRRISPSILLDIHDQKLDSISVVSLFAHCDVVVEAFDQADQKQMLIEALLSAYPQRPIVIGNGIAGWGGCDRIHVRKMDNLYICGDEETTVGVTLPPLAPKVGIVANMQANVVVELLLGSP